MLPFKTNSPTWRLIWLGTFRSYFFRVRRWTGVHDLDAAKFLTSWSCWVWVLAPIQSRIRYKLRVLKKQPDVIHQLIRGHWFIRRCLTTGGTKTLRFALFPPPPSTVLLDDFKGKFSSPRRSARPLSAGVPRGDGEGRGAQPLGGWASLSCSSSSSCRSRRWFLVIV
jgi:hypothetical protein